jgi:hypothetical protein
LFVFLVSFRVGRCVFQTDRVNTTQTSRSEYNQSITHTRANVNAGETKKVDDLFEFPTEMDLRAYQHRGGAFPTMTP